MRRHFRHPLARYGFTLCAAVAAATSQLAPFLVCLVLAAYSWRVRRR